MCTPLFSDKVAEIFVKVDDFCNEFELEFKKQALPAPKGVQKRDRKSLLSHSEIITILIAFHGGQFRNFKHFYTQYVCVHLTDCFPNAVSYNRFIELSHRSAIAFMMFLHYCCRGECTGINFIDSTVLRVCHKKRIKRNKVFKDMAKVGKSTVGWFFGFKLHLIISDKGEILSFYLSQGNVHDSSARIIPRMTKEIFGKVFGDKGYINKALCDLLFDDGIQLITAVRKNMKQKALSNEEKLLRHKRSVPESVNICQIAHTQPSQPRRVYIKHHGRNCGLFLPPQKTFHQKGY